MRYAKVVKVTEEVHQKLTAARYSYRWNGVRVGKVIPWLYFLGSKKGVICRAIKVVSSEHGCEQMPYIKTRVIHRVMIALYKAGYVPCGIARVGRFPFYPREGVSYLGDTWEEMPEVTKKMIVLSYSQIEDIVLAERLSGERIPSDPCDDCDDEGNCSGCSREGNEIKRCFLEYKVVPSKGTKRRKKCERKS